MGIRFEWGRRRVSGGLSLGKKQKTVSIEFPRLSRSSPGRERGESPRHKEDEGRRPQGQEEHERRKGLREASVVVFRG